MLPAVFYKFYEVLKEGNDWHEIPDLAQVLGAEDLKDQIEGKVRQAVSFFNDVCKKI